MAKVQSRHDIAKLSDKELEDYIVYCENHSKRGVMYEYALAEEEAREEKGVDEGLARALLPSSDQFDDWP